MSKYRVVTRDGFILKETHVLKEAQSRAIQQSKRLLETILIKRFENDTAEYRILQTIRNF